MKGHVLWNELKFPAAIGALAITITVFGQTNKSAPAVPLPPAAQGPSSRVSNPGSVMLSHEEGLEIELNSEKMNNVNLQAERVMRQITEARENLKKEYQDLLAKFSMAHGLDPAKYRLDPQAKEFVPLALPAKGVSQK